MELKLTGVQKKYGSKIVLNDFSSHLNDGIYGLLGPNGAGKTTLIHIIVQILKQNAGTISVDGTDVRSLGSSFLDYIGFLPQYPRFYPNYTAYELLEYIAVLKGLKPARIDSRIREVLHVVNLDGAVAKKVSALSGGMRQRLGIAQALLNDPKIVILDEPTAGLDPKERIRFRNLISRLSDRRIVLIATHIVSDIEYISKEVILLNQGKLIKQAAASDLMKEIQAKVWEISVSTDDEVHQVLEHYLVSNINHSHDQYRLRIVNDTQPDPSAQTAEPTLEDVYLYHFGEN